MRTAENAPMQLNGKELLVNLDDQYREILHSCGFRIVEEKPVSGEQMLDEVARDMGFPLVMKVDSRRYPHKTDQGGVIVGIDTLTSLHRAWNVMSERFPGESHFFVQRMITEGVELLLGIVNHEQFGPMLTLGIGGIFAEVMKDVVMRCCPVSCHEANMMLDSLRGRRLLDGVRGRKSVRRESLSQALSRLSHLPELRPQCAELDLNPVLCNEQGEWIVDILVREMTPEIHENHQCRDVSAYFTPRSVAVIGASRHEGKGGHVIVQNLLNSGYAGNIYPINPDIPDILGLSCFPSVETVVPPVECAILIVPRDKVTELFSRAASHGVKNFIICTAGFSDGGGAGVQLESDLARCAAKFGATFMGPNSIGTINTHQRLVTSITKLEPLTAGSVSIIGQSGVFASGFARFVTNGRGPELAKVACLGNKAVLDETDFLDYLGRDPETGVIGIYLEGICRGRTFAAVLRDVTNEKPVVIMKTGNSEQGAAAVASHTGALAIDKTVFRGVADQVGATTVSDTDAFFDALIAFEMLPLPRGNRVGVVSITGMGCVLAADDAPDLGLELVTLTAETLHKIRTVIPAWAPVRNPVDIWSGIEQQGPQKTFQTITEALADQSDVDALLLGFVVIKEAEFDYYETFDTIVRRHPGKPFVAVSYGGTEDQIHRLQLDLKRCGIPLFPSSFRAMRALGWLASYSSYRKAAVHRSTTCSGDVPDR